MGTTKTEAYTVAQMEIAQLFKAIGHPARIAILEYLIQRKTCVCGEVVDELNLSQSINNFICNNSYYSIVSSCKNDLE